MGIGPVPAAEQALERAGAVLGGHRPDRAERGLRRPGAGLLPRLESSPTPTWSASTSTARASRWATRSARPAAGSWPTCCARWTAARPATGWRRCASAAGRVWPPSSSGWREMARILYLSMSSEKYSPNYFPFLRLHRRGQVAGHRGGLARHSRRSYRQLPVLRDTRQDLDPRLGDRGRAGGLRRGRDRQHPRPGAARGEIDGRHPRARPGRDLDAHRLHDGQPILPGRREPLLRWPVRGERRQVRPARPAREHRVHGPDPARAGRLLLRSGPTQQRRSPPSRPLPARRSTRAPRSSSRQAAASPRSSTPTASARSTAHRCWTAPPRSSPRPRRRSASAGSGDVREPTPAVRQGPRGLHRGGGCRVRRGLQPARARPGGRRTGPEEGKDQ